MSSSLDFKPGAAGAANAANVVTTKPGRSKKNSNQQQEDLEREKQYQQRRRSGHPTRAKGNFGPPPHSVKSLEDLENMTEEQIYKLFMEDPELHKEFIKAAGKGNQKVNDAPSSAPVGARNGRRSEGRKPSQSSRSKRRSTNTKTLRPDDLEREVPYFQWLFLLFLIGAAIYKIRKSYIISYETKESSGISKKAIGRRQKKKKKGGKLEKQTFTTKIILEDKVKPNPPREEIEAAEKRSSPRRKRKKKSPKMKSTTLSDATTGKEEEVQAQNQHQEHEKDLESTDVSSENNDPETAKLDLAAQFESDMSFSPTIDESDETWQTVTKSSKGERKINSFIAPNVEEKNVLDHPVVGNTGDSDVISEPEKGTIEDCCQEQKKESESKEEEKQNEIKEERNTSSNDEEEITNRNEENQLKNASSNAEKEITKQNEKKEEKSAISNNEKEISNTTQPITSKAGNITEGKKIVPESNHIEKPHTVSKEESSTSTEDDALLALKLHQEEVNLARAANSNPQEEAWEEVTTKKKKGANS
jgi:hypothetical protein